MFVPSYRSPGLVHAGRRCCVAWRSGVTQVRRVARDVRMGADITVYWFPTPNGKKIPLACEEMGLDYELKTINILKDDQFTEEYKAINPNSKIPAIVDNTVEGGLKVFESGAILEYLAEKSGKLGGTDIKSRYAVKEWLYWQIGGFGPMLGQMNFFYRNKEDIPVGKDRYRTETLRLFGVLDKQLSTNTYITGDDFTIADIACYWWSYTLQKRPELAELFDQFTNVKRWQEAVAARPTVVKVEGLKID